ncbi:MFS transporter [Pseudomonas sp. S75]|uniref:MFS transporter n=1 Tax=unclassified Pseudomonas TaxID=196821 RepID=UPI0019081D5C|nr:MULTISPECIES: MFS transporter [unclassified Pseudomonas]MBJ9976494.1 MFS transporter [Pseudomonas sp. S30]MBK0156288.1 MFS transporter [Pseudomonas sp. S75]
MELTLGVGRNFLLLWASRLMAIFASAMTEFTFAVWISQKTGSTCQYATLLSLAILPGVMITPWAGKLIDRGSRKKLMLRADLISLLAMCTLFVLLNTNSLQVEMLYVINSTLSVCQVFQLIPAHSSISKLVPKAEWGRANGLMQIAFAFSRLVAPWLSGLLLSQNGLNEVLILVLTTASVGICLTLAVYIPATTWQSDSTAETTSDDNLAKKKINPFTNTPPELRSLMNYSLIESFVIGLAIMLVTPLTLTLYPVDILGRVLFFCALGMVAGAALSIAFPLPKKLLPIIITSDLLITIALVIAGLFTETAILYACGFSFMFFSIISANCNMTIWQRKIASDIQGSIFATRQALLVTSAAVATFLGGYTADALFEPAMRADGYLASSVGVLTGVGRGRGLGLMLIVAGLLFASFIILSYSKSDFRKVENSVPDAN